jgi:hypothetical protein
MSALPCPPRVSHRGQPGYVSERIDTLIQGSKGKSEYIFHITSPGGVRFLKPIYCKDQDSINIPTYVDSGDSGDISDDGGGDDDGDGEIVMMVVVVVMVR